MAIQIWQPGDKIKGDRYEILKMLGKGGFGITYLAQDNQKKQKIVIKTLNANQQGEANFAEAQEKFVNEGFILRTFNHPHIVKVYEPIQIGNLWGLVMEYIPGQDLADYVMAQGQLSEAEALAYIDQIAEALDCIHQQSFFHRDVKPHNIMLREDRREAVLIDFGIAREFIDLETIYLSNSLGTELYKPIEQYERRGRFGAYTDVYALAVTLYHLLTGSAPGGGSPLYTSKARKDAQDKGWGDRLDEHLWGELAKAGVSQKTQAAIKAGMEIEPSKRPQNMTEFRKLLGLASEAPSPFDNHKFPRYQRVVYLGGKQLNNTDGRSGMWDVFSSNDPPVVVVEYYRQQLGDTGFSASPPGGSWEIEIRKTDQFSTNKILEIKPIDADGPHRQYINLCPADAKSAIVVSTITSVVYPERTVPQKLLPRVDWETEINKRVTLKMVGVALILIGIALIVYQIIYPSAKPVAPGGVIPSMQQYKDPWLWPSFILFVLGGSFWEAGK